MLLVYSIERILVFFLDCPQLKVIFSNERHLVLHFKNNKCCLVTHEINAMKQPLVIAFYLISRKISKFCAYQNNHPDFSLKQIGIKTKTQFIKN